MGRAPIDQVLELLFIGNIAGYWKCGISACHLPDGVSHRLARFGLTAGNHHLRALQGHLLGNRLADAACRASDDRGFAFEIEHGTSLDRLRRRLK